MEPKKIVNPVALQNCLVNWGELTARVLDISFVRIVLEKNDGWEACPENESIEINLQLERFQFTARAILKARGDNWLRFSFEKIVPSSRSLLKSFLSPKKIGESLVEDWRTETLRHFHGLNESELWFEASGPVLFTYLEQSDFETQFLIRLTDQRGPLQVGRIPRREYIELSTMDADLPLSPVSDREIYVKLSECRDVVTNFRPNGQLEYHLKQRLLKVISDYLYSTSHKVESPQPRPRTTVSLPIEN